MKWIIAAAALVVASPAFSQAVVVATCGSKTFAVGQQAYVTMNTLGYLCVSSSTLREVDVNSPLPTEEAKPAREERKK